MGYLRVLGRKMNNIFEVFKGFGFFLNGDNWGKDKSIVNGLKGFWLNCYWFVLILWSWNNWFKYWRIVLEGNWSDRIIYNIRILFFND